jgi:ribonuclease BN (tRNA processing enzyme)
VEAAGRRLLLDCGPGVLTRLRAADGGWPRVDAIVLTHFHLDHCGDLVPWVWGTMYGVGRNGREPVELWVPSEGRGQLRQLGALLGTEDLFERVFRVVEYEDRVRFRVGGLACTALRVQHYTLRTYALRVEADGRTLAYSGDSGPNEVLVDAARDADLFLCEATLADGESDGQPRGHLSAREAIEASSAAGARRLLLTHRPDELDPPPAGVEVAYDGLVIDL